MLISCFILQNLCKEKNSKVALSNVQKFYNKEHYTKQQKEGIKGITKNAFIMNKNYAECMRRNNEDTEIEKNILIILILT